MTVFVDADSIIFKVAMGSKTEHEMRTKYKKFIKNIGMQCFDTDLLVCIKGTSTNFRHKLYTNYKGNRKDLPMDVKEKIQYLYGHAADKGAIHATPNWEADDQVADWVYEAHHSDMDYTIAHIDKDLDLLPGKHYNYNKDAHYVRNISDLNREFFLQLLVGDSADNLPGVKGIGKVKANKLLDDTPPHLWYSTVGDLWHAELDYFTAARCYFMGDPDKFTWNLEELYAKEEKEDDTSVEDLPGDVEEE